MTFAETLTRYHALEPKHLMQTGNGLRYAVKRGLRGYPLHPGVALMLAKADLETGALIDATGSGGLVALVC